MPIASSLPWNSSWEIGDSSVRPTMTPAGMPQDRDQPEKARANVMASPARSARNKLTFSHSVGNVAGHRRLENDPAVMREQAGNCIKGSPPQTAFERSHLALVQGEGQFRAA